MAFAQAADGTRIAYETQGLGPALILLHGGAQSRGEWVKAGYVERLKSRFQVIIVDLRGHGESDKPTQRTDYAIDTLRGDVLAVADACGATRFALVGYSYGGNLGRYLAARSPRVSRFVMIGIGFGRGAEGDFRERIETTLAPWAPVLRADPAPGALSPANQALWRDGAIRPLLAWFGALLDWPLLEPADLACPTLWLVGGANEVGALDSLAHYRPTLGGTRVEAEIVDGLDHAQELTAMEKVLPPILAFLERAGG